VCEQTAAFHVDTGPTWSLVWRSFKGHMQVKTVLNLMALIMSSAIQTQLRAWFGREIGRPETQ